jgi:UDP-2,3-diacylglucosamine pyrophosphatase LpxH
VKLDIISDLHLTCFRDHGADWVAKWEPKGDTLVLAGDVGEFQWWKLPFFILEELCDKYENVLFVPGNHDYYYSTFVEANERFAELDSKMEHFHFLNATEKIIDGVTFAGATLWFPYDPLNPLHTRYLSDFSLIRGGFDPQVYDVHREHVAFLSGTKAEVIITHHMPSEKSVHPRFENDSLNRFFVSNQEEIMYRNQPKLWIHGHTHHRFDYMVDKTRVICNPLGYPRENPDPYGPVTVEI